VPSQDIAPMLATCFTDIKDVSLVKVQDADAGKRWPGSTLAAQLVLRRRSSTSNLTPTTAASR
jgi:hypothetical protein